MKKIQFSAYRKSLQRFVKALNSGRFERLTLRRRWMLWTRLKRYSRQAGEALRMPVTVASLLGIMAVSEHASGQTFSEKTGAANPLSGVNAGAYSTPAFVDIDNDGDLDFFTGSGDGTIQFHRNTGTKTNPVYTPVTAGNPASVVTSSGNSTPAFADIDGDGDQDLFVGGFYGPLDFYRNTGTASNPVFAKASDLFGVVAVDIKPAFVDLDNDGDLDAAVVYTRIDPPYNTSLHYFQNTGSSTNPSFTEITGTSNPFNSITVQESDAPAFVDLDGDGDKDLVIGRTSTLSYYRNTGSNTAPVFVLQAPANSPLPAISAISRISPAFADIEADGDPDLFTGSSNGVIRAFTNNTRILPLNLLAFSGKHTSTSNIISWKISGETDTKEFALEKSTDGMNFSTVTILKAANANEYSATDPDAPAIKTFYRLKIIALDSRVTYSQVIWLNANAITTISVYPSPVVSNLNINIGTSTLLNSEAAIYDAAGRIQQKFRINALQQQVNVAALPKGIFTIKFADGTAARFTK